MAKEKQKKLTTASGMPVEDDQNTLTAGPRGPALMQDVHLMEKLAHFNRERIPERRDPLAGVISVTTAMLLVFLFVLPGIL